MKTYQKINLYHTCDIFFIKIGRRVVSIQLFTVFEDLFSKILDQPEVVNELKVRGTKSN